MHQTGQRLGDMLAQLHRNKIYYNDTTLSDPSGRSHLIVLSDHSLRLIDFGVSLLLDQHPSLHPEEVYNFVRTLPMFHLFSRMGTSREDMAQLLEQYRHRLANTSIEEIMARDVRFMEEGLGMAANRMGTQIIEPIKLGFQETYQPG